MKTILVTGCNGQLGSELRELAPQENEDIKFLFTDKDELDITDRKAVNLFMEQHAVSVVINCAAYTAVDKAESDEALCELLNHTAPEYLAEAAAAVEILGLKAAALQKRPVFQHRRRFLPRKLRGDGREQQLGHDGVVFLFERLKADALMRGMLVDEQDGLALLDDDIGVQRLADDAERLLVDRQLLLRGRFLHGSRDGRRGGLWFRLRFRPGSRGGGRCFSSHILELLPGCAAFPSPEGTLKSRAQSSVSQYYSLRSGHSCRPYRLRTHRRYKNRLSLWIYYL